ncbi:hypothetical protein [Eubacterium limosum]|uniref:hypothetical protein n=1 Tax=Eubacterium limosum TaxID=1736 RepID=UPI0010629D5F|nr:hypothetical protein [Eubacterium limosum]
MDKNILKYVPKSKRHVIFDAYKDQDGYWICIKHDSGFEASRMEPGCHVIHEDTIQELRYQIAGIKKRVLTNQSTALKLTIARRLITLYQPSIKKERGKI